MRAPRTFQLAPGWISDAVAIRELDKIHQKLINKILMKTYQMSMFLFPDASKQWEGKKKRGRQAGGPPPPPLTRMSILPWTWILGKTQVLGFGFILTFWKTLTTALPRCGMFKIHWHHQHNYYDLEKSKAERIKNLVENKYIFVAMCIGMQGHYIIG